MGTKLQDPNWYKMMLNIAKEQLDWDEDFYRECCLKKHGATMKNGKISSTTMSTIQLYNAYQYVKSCGFKPTKRKQTKNTSENISFAEISLMTHIWLRLAAAGVVKDQSKKAMQIWAHNQAIKFIPKNSHSTIEFYPKWLGQKLIEQLKRWAKRCNVEWEHTSGS